MKDSATDVQICGIATDKEHPLRNINITRFINEVPDSMPPFGLFVASNSLYACVFYSHIDYKFEYHPDPTSTSYVSRTMIAAPRENYSAFELLEKGNIFDYFMGRHFEYAKDAKVDKG